MATILSEQGWYETVMNVYNTSKIRKNSLDKVIAMCNKSLKAKPNDKETADKALSAFLKTNKKMGGVEGHEEVIVPEFSVKDNKLQGKFIVKDDAASIRKGYEIYLAAHGLKIVENKSK